MKNKVNLIHNGTQVRVKRRFSIKYLFTPEGWEVPVASPWLVLKDDYITYVNNAYVKKIIVLSFDHGVGLFLKDYITCRFPDGQKFENVLLDDLEIVENEEDHG